MCDSGREAAGPGGDGAQWWRWEEPPFGSPLTAGWQSGTWHLRAGQAIRRVGPGPRLLESRRLLSCGSGQGAWVSPVSGPADSLAGPGLPAPLRSGDRLWLQRRGASPAPAVRALLLSRQLKTDTHLLACGRRVPASSSSSSGRASHRGCRSPTTTVACRLRSAWRFCSASFMASISEEGVQGLGGGLVGRQASRSLFSVLPTPANRLEPRRRAGS